jgi:hypothetical protein
LKFRLPHRLARCGLIETSGSDQEGAGDTIATVPGSIACPVSAVRAWLEASNITTGPLFRPIGKGSRISTDRLADHTVVSGQSGQGERSARRA